MTVNHHPECEEYKDHTINIGKIRLCIGCFIGYPVTFLTIILIPLLNLNKIFTPQIFITFGLVFIATFILSPLNLTKTKLIKILN